MNALSPASLSELKTAIYAAGEDRDVAVVVAHRTDAPFQPEPT